MSEAITEMILPGTYIEVRSEGLIGVGGIDSAESAWGKIEAGATLIQLYSSLIYKGLGLVDEIKAGMLKRLAASGKASLSDITGSKAKDWA